jgi:transcriptional regulator with XRE-family HTH domain
MTKTIKTADEKNLAKVVDANFLYDKFNATVAKKIQGLLKEHPVTKEKTTNAALAGYLNVKPQSVSSWSNGTTTPDTKHILPISEYFGVSCDYLLGKNEGTTHERDNLMSLTGLSEKAIEAIGNWVKNPDAKNKHQQTSLNFIIETADDVDFLERLYDYLFIKYVFTNPDINGVEEKNKIYHKHRVLALTECGICSLEVDSKRLNDMHHGELINAISRLKDKHYKIHGDYEQYEEVGKKKKTTTSKKKKAQ